VSETGVTAPASRAGRASSPGRRGLRGNPRLTLLAVALGVMMVALDGTIVAVANPAIQSHHSTGRRLPLAARRVCART
jgi:hypothetical protein